MTSLQRYKRTDNVVMQPTTDGRWVLASDAEAAIVAAEKRGYEQGYKEAEEFYTNSCMLCGYAGEWSTYICDECKEKHNNEL